jgi:hypothetical protein
VLLRHRQSPLLVSIYLWSLNERFCDVDSGYDGNVRPTSVLTRDDLVSTEEANEDGLTACLPYVAYSHGIVLHNIIIIIAL